METVIRVAVIYLFLLLGLRVLGKRELGQMSPFDFVILLLIPEIVQQAMVREDFSLTNALIGVSTLICLVFIHSLLSYRFERFRTISEGSPVVLAHDGRLLEKSLDRERIPADEVFSEMHKAGLDRLEDVQWAILEPDGKIGIVPRQPPPGTQRPDASKVTI